MNIPKTFILLLIGTAFNSGIVCAQDTSKNVYSHSPIFAAVEIEPTFPGGKQAFYRYIASALKYPTVARLLGLTGMVYITFVVDKDGSVTDVTPIKCLGAGCESEAVRVVSMSPKWNPGAQKGQPVRVIYTVPITFDLVTENGESAYIDKTFMKHLRKSQYGFAFFIKGQTYSLDDAQKILGKSFDPANIETVENYDDPKYVVPDKKGTYLVVMKNEQ
jgi:protein TonB